MRREGVAVQLRVGPMGRVNLGQLSLDLDVVPSARIIIVVTREVCDARASVAGKNNSTMSVPTGLMFDASRVYGGAAVGVERHLHGDGQRVGSRCVAYHDHRVLSTIRRTHPSISFQLLLEIRRTAPFKSIHFIFVTPGFTKTKRLEFIFFRPPHGVMLMA